FIRIEDMKNPNADFKFKLKSCIHYASSSFISKNKNFIKESPCKLLTIASVPIGYALYKYIIKNT
ncbi:MAG: glycosyltransferase family 2 protein, partial [Romboutsia timonensis]|nr:glycosyltransferase family 2 protein [Romboutsia timonensis]